MMNLGSKRNQTHTICTNYDKCKSLSKIVELCLDVSLMLITID
jgi:hypothetical protein